MQSRRFRSQQFCVGDLVEPNWKPDKPHGLGIVLDVEHNRWDEKAITVYWQLSFTSKESPIDLILLEQAID